MRYDNYYDPRYDGYYEPMKVSFIPKINSEEIENEGQSQPLSLLEHIDHIVRIYISMLEHRENAGKKAKYQEALDRHLAVCSSTLGISPFQAVLFSFILNYEKIMLEFLAGVMQVTRVQCLKYLDDLDALLNKRLIRKYRGDSELTHNYWIPLEVIQALREERAFTPPRYKDLSKDDFFNHLKNLFLRQEINEDIFIMDFDNLFNDNAHLEFVIKINALSLTKDNVIYLSFLCTQSFLKKDFFRGFNPDLQELLGRKFDSGTQQLFELGLVEYAGDDFMDEKHIVLTHKALSELLGVHDALLKQKLNSDLIYYENIGFKELFYNSKEGKQVEQLTDLLLEKNYVKVTERLKAKGMRTGFSCLFFGAPGTGKTETAFQIARISGRNIMPIDISMTKSHWFGESEKIIKTIFVQYQNTVKKAVSKNIPVPILLLNEADAIINKRKDTSLSGVVQTENAIQNIILEELEKLEGIMIATTNLTENIDTAFDRRFIYKIEFQKPGIEIRQSIWKSFIPELTEEDGKKLAETYNLSGGQIENIARKRTITGIINGIEPDIADMINFCSDESMQKNDKQVGFKLS